MKFNSFLAFLFTLVAILVIVVGVALQFSETFFPTTNCDGYSLLVFPDENTVDALVGKGSLIRFWAVNSGSFGDEYQVSLSGPTWAVIKPTVFTLRSGEEKPLFVYISPDLGVKGKYNIDVTVKSKCVSETARIEVGVLPKEIS
jgi:hypothetical protein